MATASSCRRIGTTAERLGYASTGTKAVRLEGFERYRLFTTVALRDQNEVRETTVHAGTVVVYVYVAGLRWWTR